MLSFHEKLFPIFLVSFSSQHFENAGNLFINIQTKCCKGEDGVLSLTVGLWTEFAEKDDEWILSNL